MSSGGSIPLASSSAQAARSTRARCKTNLAPSSRACAATRAASTDAARSAKSFKVVGRWTAGRGDGATAVVIAPPDALARRDIVDALPVGCAYAGLREGPLWQTLAQSFTARR